MMEILDTGISSANDNMRFDEKLLENLSPNDEPLLHLYHWERPSATYGYFIRPGNHLNFERATYHNLDLAQDQLVEGSFFIFGILLFHS